MSDRLTDNHEGPLVVLLIGMRVNAWWKPWAWLPMLMAMGRMLRELSLAPERGLMSYEAYFGRTSLMVQYWRSHGALQAYAHDKKAEHVPAWARYARTAGRSGDVGVWHETYLVPAAAHESIYVHMPPFGLGRAAGTVQAGGRREHAMGRLSA